MAGNGGPTPKRRKTTQETGPVTASAIAQANSTAQFFTGQVQNRWMSGHRPQEHASNAPNTPSTADQHASPSSTPRSRTNEQQRQQSGHETSPVVGSRGRTANSAHRSTSEHYAAPSQGATQMAAGGSMSPVVAIATSHLVDYQSPAAASTQNQAAPFAHTAGPPRGSISYPQHHQGLPSPGSSDGNMHSPAMFGQMRLPTTIPAPQQPRRGRPPRSSSTPQANATMPPQTRPMAPPTTLPSSPLVQLPRSVSNPRLNEPYFNPQDMRNRAMFAMKNVPPDKYFDHGRLTLLCEAIQQQDWFYIVLSQIHALSSNPVNLPAVARNPAGFACLASILAANANVSPYTLQVLSVFPAPLLDIYSSSDRDIYDWHVKHVARFLHYLPMHWDGLVAACKQRHAPPLIEDMFDCFVLPSRVLQTTIFRAIGRLILLSGANSDGEVQGLEPLHRLNQEFFCRGQRRVGEDRTIAHMALRDALYAWQKYQANNKAIRAQQADWPREKRAQPLDFIIPPRAEEVFRSAPSSNPAVAASTGAGVGPSTASASGDQPINTNPLNMHIAYNQMIVAAQQQQPGPHLVFPHETAQARPLPTQPDPIRSGLHQAHLCSPPLTPAGTSGEEKPRLYRYVKSTFAVSPSKVDENIPINVFKFHIEGDSFDNIPRKPAATDPSGGAMSLTLDPSSLTYRLRCIAIPARGIPDERTWIQADTVWPDALFLDLNGEMLETRKKLHHGRNLPIDLTPHIRPGENHLRLFVNRISNDTRTFAYAIAAEVVGVKTHEDIAWSLTHIRSDDSMEAIKQSLCAGSGSDNDDGFAIISSNLTISLFDPYSGDRMVKTPVRGSGCLHKDCFDLEIFLSMCKRTHPDGPTVVDCWRCPICRGDVRPQTLVTDEFLVEVLAELKRKGLSSTRAIVVDQDGSWRPKADEQTGVRSPSLEREERTDLQVKESGRKVSEIIELD